MLDYIITPSRSSINTEVLVDGSTVVEMTVTLNQRATNSPRFFSSNDTNTDSPGWKEPGTWGLQFADSGNTLSIKVLGSTTLSDPVIRTNITYNDLSGSKYRYNITAAGILNIYDTSDNVYKTYDVTQYTDASYISSTPIKLFHRYASHEYFNANSYIYDVKIWKNNTLIRHYIPVKRLSDNVYGLYDLENEIFHANEVSGYSFSGVSKSEPEYIDESTIEQIHINRIYNRGTIYFGTPPTQPPVQYTYEVLEEIHADNYTTYVNTGVYTSSSISVEAKWKCNPNHMPVGGNNDRIIASSSAWNSRNTMAFDFENTPHLQWKFIGDTGWTSDTSITTDSNEHICKLSATEFVYDGVVISSHSQTSIGTTSSEIRIAQADLIVREHEQGYYYYYYVKIWDGETLVRHYVPVKRLADNVYGFYDMVNDTFNPSAGDYDFTGTSKSTPEYI